MGYTAARRRLHALVRRGHQAQRSLRPRTALFAEGDSGSHMRLNFSNATPEMLREGIRRLSIAVAHEIEHTASLEMSVTA